jgi:phosphoenolpyruvate carboxykinase (GTP)
MAMLPFCGYNMAEYFMHWLQMGQKMTRPPKIFHVNWFRQDVDGQYLWPGYGENLRALEWILARCRGEAEGNATPIGYVPTPDSLDLTGLNLTEEVLQELLTVDREAWLKETQDIEEFYKTFNEKLPHALRDELASLKRRLTT